MDGLRLARRPEGYGLASFAAQKHRRESKPVQDRGGRAPINVWARGEPSRVDRGGEAQDGLRLVDGAVAAQPERARSQVGLARSNLALGDRTEAVRVLERARAAGVSAADLRDASRNAPEFETLAGDAKFKALMSDASDAAPAN